MLRPSVRPAETFSRMHSCTSSPQKWIIRILQKAFIMNIGCEHRKWTQDTHTHKAQSTWLNDWSIRPSVAMAPNLPILLNNVSLSHAWRSTVSARHRRNIALLPLNCRSDNYGSSKNVGLLKEFEALD